MNIVEFTAELKGFDGENANIGVRNKLYTENRAIIALGYEAILKCMRDANPKAFYMAMIEFVDNDEYNNACKFIEELHNE